MSEIIPQEAMDEMMRIFGSETGEPNAKIYFSRLDSSVGADGSVPFDSEESIYGYFYPETPYETLLLRTSMDLKFLTESQVAIYEGGCRITIPRYDLQGEENKAWKRIAHGDVIVMTGEQETRRDREICLIKKKDYLVSFDVIEVDYVSEKKKIFKEGTDYKVTYGKKTTIEWLPGGEKPRSYYSVEYIAHINYLVWESQAKVRGAMNSNAPRQIKCRLRPNYDENVRSVLDINTSQPSNKVHGEDNK